MPGNTAKTELFGQWLSGNMVIADQGKSTGRRVFVHSGTGTDAGGYGASPERPVATLDYAVALCTADKGDVIYLMPGHAEAIAGATGAVLDIAGIQVIGLGQGSLQPTFTLGTDPGATISVTVANVLIRNVKIISDLADVAAGITLAATADGAVIEDCWLTDGGLTKELVLGISMAAACHNVKIRRCRFQTTHSDETGGCESAIKAVGASNDLEISDCYVHGHYTAAAIALSAAAGTGVDVARNKVINIDTGAGLGIVFHASSTGFCSDNRVTNLKDTVAGVSGAGMAYAENYGSNALNASGILKPAADS